MKDADISYEEENQIIYNFIDSYKQQFFTKLETLLLSMEENEDSSMYVKHGFEYDFLCHYLSIRHNIPLPIMIEIVESITDDQSQDKLYDVYLENLEDEIEERMPRIERARLEKSVKATKKKSKTTKI